MYHEVVSKDGGTEHKRGLAMDDQTKNTIKQAIAHIHSNIDTYEDAIGQDPTYDDERILNDALAGIERACYALRILQSRLMSDNQRAKVA
jgi:hypothetical protein